MIGIIRNQGNLMDTFYAYVPLDVAQNFLDTQGKVSGVEIELDSFDHAAAVKSTLASDLEFPYVVRSWEDLFGSFLSDERPRSEQLGDTLVG